MIRVVARFTALRAESQGHWARLTLTNPRKCNILNTSTLSQLTKEIKLAYADPKVKAVQLRAEGPIFSSGHDLKEISTSTQCFDEIAALCLLIGKGPKPVVAFATGLVNAAGCQLVAACSHSVALRSSKFACSGIKVGLFCATPAVEVARKVPQRVALQMLLTGEPISAEAGKQFGLISECVDSEEAMEQWAEQAIAD